MANPRYNKDSPIQMSTNEINSVVQSLKDVEQSLEKHKNMILSLKDLYVGETETVVFGAYDTSAHQHKGQGRRQKDPTKEVTHHLSTPGTGSSSPSLLGKNYSPPLAENITHPSKSKHAVSSLVLAEDFRREFDCMFNVSINHPVPLIGRKPIWIGGYTNSNKFVGCHWGSQLDPAQSVMTGGYQDTSVAVCPYIDLDSGVYTCSLQQSYTFTVKTTVHGDGWEAVKVFLCRDRDGQREVMSSIVGNRSQGGRGYNRFGVQGNPTYPTIVEGNGRAVWECEVNDRVWLEVMCSGAADDGYLVLAGVSFSGGLTKTTNKQLQYEGRDQYFENEQLQYEGRDQYFENEQLQYDVGDPHFGSRSNFR